MWTESRERLPTYLSVGGSGLNVVHACSLFFFFFFFLKKNLVQDMLTSGHDKMRISIVILNFGHASHRFDGFEVLDVLPRGSMDLNLDVLPRGPMV